MRISRRDFLKYCTASAAALGLHSALGPLAKALVSASVALRPSPKSKAAATLPLRTPIADGGLAQHRVALR